LASQEHLKNDAHKAGGLIIIENYTFFKYYGFMSPKYDPNLEKYLKEYQENPRSKVFAPLAEAYRKSGLIDEAIEICREGLEYHPNFNSGIVALARCYFDKALYTAAIKELEKVVSEVPDNYLAQKLLAQSYSMVGDKNNCLKAYKTVLFLNPRDEDVKKIIAEMEGTVEKVPSSFLPDEHQEKADFYIPPLPQFSPPEFDHIEPEEDKDLKFQEKPAGLAFKKIMEKEISEEHIPEELSTMTIGELLETQGLKEKAAEVYRKLLTSEPENTLLKAKLNNVEKELGLGDFSDTDDAEEETSQQGKGLGSQPEETKPFEDSLSNIKLINKSEIPAFQPLSHHEDLDELLDDRWLLGESVNEDTKLKKLYALLDGILKYKGSHSSR